MVTRLWELEVDPAQLGAFGAVGAENLEVTIRLEPGVLMMHAVQLADDPTQVRVLEAYAGREAYESHIQTPHFLKYKNRTERMVRSLELPLANPIMLAAAPAPRNDCTGAGEVMKQDIAAPVGIILGMLLSSMPPS